MAKKAKQQYICEHCGYVSGKWLGRCPQCKAWDSLVLQVPVAGVAGATAPAPTRIADLARHEQLPRWSTGIGEWDRVVGGGILPGGIYLVGGEPGIGKSTLMLQLLDRFLQQGLRALYVSGEESAPQIYQRMDRLGLHLAELQVLADAELHAIEAALDQIRPQVVVIDSVQTLYANDVGTAPGTLTQLRACTTRLMQRAKRQGFALILIGHVTKAGQLAGPKTLEHMVDGVFYFEGDRQLAYRMIRAVKHRFGPVEEVGIFTMTEQGLQEVPNPAAAWLEPLEEGTRVGGILCPVLEGVRSLVLEVQALVAPTVFAAGRRTALGVGLNRVHMIAAVLERRAGVPLSRYDVYVKLSAGFHSRDPALDLALVAAMYSSFKNLAVPVNWAAFGELALTGRVRPVPYAERRVQALQRIGVQRVFAPAAKDAGADHAAWSPVTSVEELIEKLETEVPGT